MAINAEVKEFTLATSTGNQDITSYANQPKLVIPFSTRQDGATRAANNAYFNIGAGVSSTERLTYSIYDDDNATTTVCEHNFLTSKLGSVIQNGSAQIEFDLVSMLSNGFRINNTVANATARHYSALALSGSNLDVAVGSFDTGTSTGNKVITSGLSFKPSVFIFLGVSNTSEGIQNDSRSLIGFATSSSNRAATAANSDDNLGTSNAASLQLTDKCIIEIDASGSVVMSADFVSLDAAGGTVNITAAPPASRRIGYIALGGVDAEVISFNQATSTGNQTISGLTLDPECVFLASHCQAASGSAYNDWQQMFGVGSSSSSRGVIQAIIKDNVSTADSTRTWQEDEIIAIYDTSKSVVTEADLVSLGTGQFVINNTTVDATARQIIGLVIAEAETAIAGTAIAGTGAQTLSGVSQAGVGSLSVNATSVQTLKNITQVGAGDLPVSGISALALSGCTQSAAGDLPISATSAQVLTGVTQAAVGDLPITSTSAQTLTAITQSGVGDLPITGTSAQTLPSIAEAATGESSSSATSAQTLPSLTQAAVGNLPISATSAQTLSGATQSGAGELPISATSTQTLTPVTQSGAGDLPIAATSTQTLTAITQAATGSLGSVSTGTSTMVLSTLTQAAIGKLPISGTSSQTLPSITDSGAGELPISGTSSQVLSGITHAGVAELVISGVATQTLAAVLQAGVGILAAGIHYEEHELNGTRDLTKNLAGARAMNRTAAATRDLSQSLNGARAMNRTANATRDLTKNLEGEI